MVDKKDSKYWKKSWLLIAAFIAGLFIAETLTLRPVHAQCCAEAAKAVLETAEKEKWYWLKEIAVIGDIFKILTFLNDKFNEYLKLFKEKIDTLIAVTHVGDALKARMQLYGVQAQVSANAAITEASLTSETVGNRFRHPKVKIDCYTWLARLNMVQGSSTAKSMADKITEMIEKRMLGPNAGGLSGVADLFEAACPGNNKNLPKSLPLASKPPEKCKGTTEHEGRAFSFRNFGPNIPKVWPRYEEKATPDGQKFLVVVPRTPHEVNAYLAFLVLYNAAGVRPPPPYGKEIESPEGIIQTVAWNKRASHESAQAGVVAEWLAYNIRANCEMSEFKDLCESSKKVVEKLKTAGFDPSKVFNEYKDSLSQYEKDMAGALIALGAKNAEQLALAGSSAGESVKISAANLGAWFLWQNKVTQMENAAAAAFAALSQMGPWPGEIGPTKITTTSNEDNVEKTGGAKKASAKKIPSHDSDIDKLKKISAKDIESSSADNDRAKAKENMRLGIPVSADEINLPTTVEQ